MNAKTDSTDFTDFRDHLRDHLNARKTSGRPLLIVTTEGEPDAVVLSPDVYEALVSRAQMNESLARLDQGMDDIRAGRARPMKQAIREIADELGLPFEVSATT